MFSCLFLTHLNHLIHKITKYIYINAFKYLIFNRLFYSNRTRIIEVNVRLNLVFQNLEFKSFHKLCCKIPFAKILILHQFLMKRNRCFYSFNNIFI